MKPVIGITPQITDDEEKLTIGSHYISMIEGCGGLASILTYGDNSKIPMQLKKVDGILLTGGGDIDPYYFGEVPIKDIGTITPMRDEYEIKLCQIAIEKDIPVLGICRGIQILAVAANGKVAQDIYSVYKENFIIKHSQDAPRRYPTHEVTIYENSKLNQIIVKRVIRVNSFHHQAVSAIGENIEISALAPDGIIEAIEHKDKRFILGVQWHPENMYKYHTEQKKIAEAFILACSK